MSESLETWSWPTFQRYHGPHVFTLTNLNQIPTGSLYFASIKGPLADTSVKITRCPYDLVGIIFQSNTNSKEGTYLFTINPLLSENNSTDVTIVDLTSLMSGNPNIAKHAILPIKEFSKDNTKLVIQRNHILKNLFRKYRDQKPTYNLNRTVGALINSPSIATDNSFTCSELISLVLFQAGLIWDGKFATSNRNPLFCFEECFFQQLLTDKSHLVITLTTPQIHSTLKYDERPTTKKDITKEYPDIIGQTVRENLRKYLEDTLDNGPQCEITETDDPQEEHSDFYECEYKRCYYPTKWVQEAKDVIEPAKKTVIAQTISFGQLRPADFLIDSAEEFLSDEDINKLNMSWYHNKLIPLELSETSEEPTIISTEVIENIIANLPKSKTSLLTGSLLMKFCRRMSELSTQLHTLALEAKTYLKRGTSRPEPLALYQDDDRTEYKFKIIIDNSDKYATEYLLILHRYMWRSGWCYTWKDLLKLTYSDYYELISRVNKLIDDFIELYQRIPKSCIIVEVAVYLLEQSRLLQKYLTSCRENCTTKRL